MVRKKPTSRFRGSSVFDKRIVITLPRSAVAILAGAIGCAVMVPISAGRIITGIGFIVAIVSIATVAEARHQVRNFRYEMREKVVAELDDKIVLKDLEPIKEVNGHTSDRVIRVSK